MTKQEKRYQQAYKINSIIIILTAILFSVFNFVEKHVVPGIVLLGIAGISLLVCFLLRKKLSLKIRALIIATAMYLCSFVPGILTHNLIGSLIICLVAVLLSMFYYDVFILKYLIILANASMLIAVILFRKIAFVDFAIMDFIKSWVVLLYGLAIAYLVVKLGTKDLTASEKKEAEVSELLKELTEKMEHEKEVQKSKNEIGLKVAGISTSIEKSAKGITEIIDVLSDGSTRQASAVEELSSTLSNVRHGAEDNGAIADNLKTITDKTSESVTRGSIQMDDIVKAMLHIKSASDKISNIVKDINSISFQTNILALNASVEAARAGEAGKGFSVVANEVRNLSAKSAEAANNTALLIDETISAISDGNSIVAKAAESFTEINEDSKQIRLLVENILKSSFEQKDAINEIVYGIQQISEVIQNNTATAEETAASTHELFEKTKDLNKVIKHLNS